MLLLLLASSSTAAFALGDAGRFHAIAIDPQHRAVVAGWSEGGLVERYLADGRRDPAFRSPRVGERFFDVAIDGSDRIVAAGIDGRRTIVARFLADGSLDPAFGDRGVARSGPSLRDRDGEASDRFHSIAVDRTNRIVTAGVARGFRPSGWSGWFFCRWLDLGLCWSLESTSILARFTEAGALDPTFAGRGFVLGKEGARWHTGPHDELMQAILVGDRIAAAGWAAGPTYDDERTILAVFTSTGALERSVVGPPDSHAGGTKEVYYGLAFDGDRIVACGFSFAREHTMRALIASYDRSLRLHSAAVTDARQLAGSDVEDLVQCAVDGDAIVGVGFTDDDWRQDDQPDRALLVRYDGTWKAFSSWQDGRSVFGERKNDGFYDLAIDGDRVWAVGSASDRTLVAWFSRQ